jgi:hypothetical protein
MHGSRLSLVRPIRECNGPWSACGLIVSALLTQNKTAHELSHHVRFVGRSAVGSGYA